MREKIAERGRLKKMKPFRIYAIRNKSTGHFLNIRITDSDNNILWNSFKEKRFWIDGSKEKAICQSDLIPNSEVVEIITLKEKTPCANTTNLK